MRRYLAFLFPVAAFFLALHPLYAQAKQYAVIGSRVVSDEMLVCEKKADAVTFVQAMHDKGLEAAQAFFQHAKGCGIASGEFRVGPVQYVTGVPKMGLAKVVEIMTSEGKRYWITNISIFQPGEKAA